MRILLTNDDSHRSPLLEFVIEQLSKISELTVVVPKREQSWKGKSMTRFGSLHLEKQLLFGHDSYILDGTPADCVNVGIHNILATPPDLVVAGINAGLNTGTAFIFSSGTVGACLEANIAGIPALSLSQEFDSNTRNAYVMDYTLSVETIDRLRHQTRHLLNRLLAFVMYAGKAAIEKGTTWNVNFPFQARAQANFVACRLGFTKYGRCYKRVGDAFEHDLSGLTRDDGCDTDSFVLSQGDVSLTPLNIDCFGQLAAEEMHGLSARLQGR